MTGMLVTGIEASRSSRQVQLQYKFRINVLGAGICSEVVDFTVEIAKLKDEMLLFCVLWVETVVIRLGFFVRVLEY